MQDNIYLDALPQMAKGIEKAASVVAKTIGAKGSNVALEHTLNPKHLLTNDGATIIQAIQLADPLEAIGLGFLKEAVDRSNNNSGDGSTTTSILLNSILQEGLKSGVSTLEIKQSLDECLPIIDKSIDEQTKQITVESIPAVARIAGESDELAGVLGEVYTVIGKDGIIHLEGSGTYQTSYTLIDGVRFSGTGFLSSYMVHDEKAEKEGLKQTKAIYHKPSILVTKRKIGHINDINPILGALQAQNKKDLIIFTDDMDSGVASLLIQAHKDKVINLLIIKAPVLWKNYVFEDFAKITGSTIVEDSTGVTFKNFKLDYLGTCDTIIVDKEETTVIGIADISDHIAELGNEGTTDAKLRLSWLTTKTAILKLGAKSETELSYLRLKAEDAIHSSRLALKHGIVPGGGVALLNASKMLPDTIGGKILKVALLAPIKQISTNAGNPLVENWWLQDRKPTANDATVAYSKMSHSTTFGIDAKTGKIVDMFDAGIVDSAIVVKRAIQNALGIASTLLTTSSVITLPPPSAEELANKSVMRPLGF